MVQAVGTQIAHMRESAGLTQEDVAEQLGIGNQAVSRMERGAVAPTLTRLFEFAEVFRCRVDELLLTASDRETDQAAVIAQQITGLAPADREMVARIVAQLTEHLRPKAPSRVGRN